MAAGNAHSGAALEKNLSGPQNMDSTLVDARNQLTFKKYSTSTETILPKDKTSLRGHIQGLALGYFFSKWTPC